VTTSESAAPPITGDMTGFLATVRQPGRLNGAADACTKHGTAVAAGTIKAGRGQEALTLGTWPLTRAPTAGSSLASAGWPAAIGLCCH
jgi:hypothetical protein